LATNGQQSGNLEDRRKNKTAEPLWFQGFEDDSDWARTSDLHPVKVALSLLSYGIILTKQMNF
jgi:hypothetical protein